jgi:hypothetical protein
VKHLLGALPDRSGAVFRFTLLTALIGCGGARPTGPSLGKAELSDRSGPGHRVKAVAWAGGSVVVAMNQPTAGFVERPGKWKTALGGAAGPMAVFGAASSATAATQLLATEQSEPGTAAALLLGVADGEVQKRIAILSTEYLTLSDVAGCEGGGAVIAGSFGGTLRVGERGVSTGGQRDGFVAVLDAGGAVTQLTRMGGEGDDGFLAADCRGDDVVAVGTIAMGAELFGKELPRLSEKTVTADGILLKLRRGELVWQAAFGGPREDLPSDVALTARGDIAVVGMARGELTAGSLSFAVSGSVDGYLARWSADGVAQDALLLGGADYDATTKVVALGERLAIAGFFSGTIEVGGAALAARGGDDAMLVFVEGRALRAVQLGGEGREEIAALAAAGGGVVLGVSHTAGVTVGGLQAPSPADPLGGAAVVILPTP